MRVIVTPWASNRWRIVYYAGEQFALIVGHKSCDHEPTESDIFTFFPEKHLKDYGVYKARAVGPEEEHEYRLELVDDGKDHVTLDLDLEAP